jgi:hypothetical protein
MAGEGINRAWSDVKYSYAANLKIIVLVGTFDLAVERCAYYSYVRRCHYAHDLISL